MHVPHTPSNTYLHAISDLCHHIALSGKKERLGRCTFMGKDTPISSTGSTAARDGRAPNPATVLPVASQLENAPSVRGIPSSFPPRAYTKSNPKMLRHTLPVSTAAAIQLNTISSRLAARQKKSTIESGRNAPLRNKIDNSIAIKYPKVSLPSCNRHRHEQTQCRDLSNSKLELQTIAASLVHPSIQKSTYALYATYHSYFDQLMTSMQHKLTPTVENSLLMIADMLSKNYSSRYISVLITSLRYHRNMSANPDLILSNLQIKLALANVHQRPVTEDTRFPITPEAIISMSSIADRDFLVQNALMAKAALWLAFTCMLRKGEYSHSRVNSNPLKTEHITISRNSLCIFLKVGKPKNRCTTIKYSYVEGTRSKAYAALRNYQKICDTMTLATSDSFFLTDDGKPLDNYIWSPFFNHMLDHSDWHGLQITTHSLRIGGTTVGSIMGKTTWKFNDSVAGAMTTSSNTCTLILPPLTNCGKHLLTGESEKQSYITFAPVRSMPPIQVVMPERPRYNALRDNNDTSRLSDRLELIMCEWRRQQCRKAAEQHAFITPALRSTHAFVKSNLQAIPFVSPHVIDWNHITNHYQGDKLWFSLAVWMAKCRWRRWDKEGCSPRANKHHPTYLLTTHEPLQILVNTKLVTPHDIQKAKTLLTSYRQFTKTITPEQQIIWDAVEPKKGKKNAYIPNSVWVSKEQMERQQCYITYGNASEPEETFKNIQYKYPKGDSRPKAARGMPTMHLPSGTCRQGAASLCIMPFSTHDLSS